MRAGAAVELEELLGPMLGADFLYVHGELLERHVGESELTHEFWGYRRDRWRSQRSDGLSFVDSPAGSLTMSRRKVLEQSASRHGPGFHLAERLLRPIHAPIWGRVTDDWRLSGAPEVLESSGRLRLGLVATEQPAERVGHIEVDPETGRLWNVTTPNFSWQLQWLTEESESSFDELFSLPV